MRADDFDGDVRKTGAGSLTLGGDAGIFAAGDILMENAEVIQGQE